MNEQQTNHSHANSTYSPESMDAHSNPFNGEQGGEFTSNFGTNTNAVSQIFKEGQFTQNRSKMIMIGAAALLVVGGLLFFFMSGSSSEDEFAAEETFEETATDDAAKTEATDAPTEATATEAAPAAEATAATEAAPSAPVATNAPVLLEPANGASRAYDETSGAATFSWEGSPGGWIVFSRHPSMNPQVMKVKVEGNSYMLNQPWPGTWYWRVDNDAGSSEIRSFNISGAVRRNVMIAEPQENGTLSGNGGMVSWQGDSKIAYYKVELSNGSWANPMHKFSTSGTQVQLQGVAAGQYQLRVGAFSEVAGRWEYTRPIAVTVQ